MLALLIVAAGCSGDAFETGGTETSAPSGTEAPTTSQTGTVADPPDTTSTTATPATTAPPSTAVETTAATGPSSILARIESSGVVRVGVFNRAALPLADPQGRGFEPALARELADRVFGGARVDFVPLSAAERFTALEAGSVDMLIRGTAHTTSRSELAAFTVPYLLDGIAVVVADDSGIVSPDDLDGTVIAVLAGTSLELEATERLAGMSVDLLAAEDPRALFASGNADGYVDSWLSAMIAMGAEPGLRTVWLGVTDPIAIAVPLGDPEFVALVDQTLREIIDDGTWQALIAGFWPEPVPWTRAEMLAQPPSDR
jgi:ABC-type amino acid transport substrate-binding protein